MHSLEEGSIGVTGKLEIMFGLLIKATKAYIHLKQFLKWNLCILNMTLIWLIFMTLNMTLFEINWSKPIFLKTCCHAAYATWDTDDFTMSNFQICQIDPITSSYSYYCSCCERLYMNCFGTYLDTVKMPLGCCWHVVGSATMA